MSTTDNQDYKSSRVELILLTLIFFYFFITRLFILFSSNYAWGTDGYYYASQLKHFWQRGAFFSNDSSIILKYLLLFSSLSDDYVFTNKLAVAIMGTLVMWPAYLLGKMSMRNYGGFTFSGIIMSNSLMIYFCLEYIKNLGGIFFFLFFLYFIYQLLQNRHQPSKWILTFIFASLTLLSHKLMGSYAIIILLSTVLFLKVKKPAGVIIIFASISVAVFLTGIYLPNFLHYMDFTRFQDILFFPGQLPFLSFIKTIKPSLLQTVEVIVFSVSPVFLLLNSRKEKKTFENKILLILMGIIFIISSIPFIRFNNMDLAFRLFLIILIPGGFFISYALAGIINNKVIIILMMSVLLYQFSSFHTFRHPSAMDYSLYDKICDQINIPKESILIAHQGFDNFFYYKTGIDSFRFLPEKKHKNRPVYRLAHGIKDEHWEKYLPGEEIINLPGEYTLLKERDWEIFLSRLPFKKQQEYLNWKNPYLHRPSYMLRNDKLQFQK